MSSFEVSSGFNKITVHLHVCANLWRAMCSKTGTCRSGCAGRGTGFTELLLKMFC